MHKRLIAFCTLIGILAGWFAILAWPRTYLSEAKLIVRVGRENVSLDPTATTGSTLLFQKTQQEEIVSVLEVLSSRQIIETVVDNLTPAAILDGQLVGAASQEQAVTDEGSLGDQVLRSYRSVQSSASKSLQKFLLTAGVKESLGDRELAIMKLQSSLAIHSPRDSTVIVIDAKAKTPTMAQAIAKEVTASFLDQHLMASHTEGSLEFFETQSAEVEVQLNRLVEQRSDFMQERKIVSIEGNRSLLQDRLTGIDRDLVIASGELEQAISEINDLKAKIEEADDEIVSSKLAGSNPTWSGMRQQVYELEIQEQELAARSTGDHPMLRVIQAQLEGARKALAELDSQRVDENTTPNPLKMKLREDLQLQQTRVAGLRSMVETKEQQRSEMEQRIDELLDGEEKLTETDRNIRLMDASLQMLREKLEEARVLDELNSKEISNIHVFQPASFVERPVSPKKPMLGAGFLCLGLMTGLGLSFLREGASPTLRTSDDIEFQLGIPVVSTLPAMRRMRTPRLKDQQLMRQKCQALVSEVLLSQGNRSRLHGRSLGVIGVDLGAGASTLAVNLATVSSTDFNMKTMLVDADNRQRSVSKRFGLNGSPGLVELVGGHASHDECVQRADNVAVDLVASAADNCDAVLTSGPAEIVQALQAYQHECDLMVVDLPAASDPNQAIALAQHLDCVLVVVESEKTLLAAAERLLSRLADSETNVVGVVLNKTRCYLPRVMRGFVHPRV
ncbi:GumC family protein [Novipirellula artificiosorum]|nr:P-loop NTPase [Novipirellula artificiosorum]